MPSMQPRFPTASFRLSSLLASPFRFTIPAYQRSYSWTVKEAGQLLEDLTMAAGVNGAGDGEPDYFLSSIVLLTTDGEDNGRVPGSRVFEIVDGQQRLITITILAAALRSFESDRRSRLWTRLDNLVFVNELGAQRGSVPIRVELRGRERTCFENLARVQSPADEVPREDPLNVGEANLLSVWDHFVNELSQLDGTERHQLSNYICERCHLVVIFTREIDRAHRMFTVLNERGRPLQRNDILKAEVLRRVPAGREVPAAMQWDHAANLLGRDFEQFFSHLRLLHGKQKPPIVAGIRSIIDEMGGPEHFLDEELAPLANAYHLVLHANNRSLRMDEEIRRHLIYLGRLSGQEWVPAALLILKLHGGDRERARRLIAEIDRLAHLLRILGLGNGKRVSRFAAISESLRNPEGLDPGARVFQISREEMKSIAYNLKDLHQRNPQICKLVLLRLNDAVTGEVAPVDPADYTVEHVLPLRPSATGEWRQWFPDPEERKACSECLGNLVPVSPKQNDRARNQEFRRKQQVYAFAGDGVPVLAITQEVIAAQSWRPADIRAREARFFRILSRIWRLDIDLPLQAAE